LSCLVLSYLILSVCLYPNRTRIQKIYKSRPCTDTRSVVERYGEKKRRICGSLAVFLKRPKRRAR
jgi:hypothetical protein